MYRIITGLVLITSLLSISSPTQAANDIVFVRPVATGTGDGSSWANATTLQDALQNRVQANDRDEIWVAQGTHYPTTGSDRNASFDLVSGVSVYGGFAGNEMNREERDWEVHETILSGDIGASGNASDNSYRVVTSEGVDAAAVLDGFTITGGTRSGFLNRGSPTLINLVLRGNGGGGILNSRSASTLTNITAYDNTSAGGAGIHNFLSNTILVNISVYNNDAVSSGGGIANNGGNPILINVTVSGNRTRFGDGGGIYNVGSDVILINVTVSGNQADGRGGGIYNSNSDPVIQNSIIWGNTSAQVVNSGSSAPSYANTLVQGQAVGGFNGTEDPQFVAPEDPANAPTTAGNYRLQVGSPAIEAGDNTFNSATTDLDGNPRKIGTIDLGAYEYQPMVTALSRLHLPVVQR